MTIKDKLMALATKEGDPCVTISLNTHRTHPDSAVDRILLKDLMKEAKERLLEEKGKKAAEPLIQKMKKTAEGINENYNLDSLHIFISGDTDEVVRIAWPTYENMVTIDKYFDLRSIIKAYNRTEEYFIMLLSQGGTKLYLAMNDIITEEIEKEGFPFAETPWYAANGDERSNAEHMDNMLRAYFNGIDKAFVKVYNENKLPCVIISTEDNYTHFQQIMDRPDLYAGHVAVNYNHTEPHYLAKQAWEVMEEIQDKNRMAAVQEVEDAVSAQKVVTDLQEVYQAAIDGRGDLLVVYEDYSQPVIMKDERTFELTDDPTAPGVVDDIVGDIAREVFLKGGRVVFTCRDDIRNLGDMVLKVRY